MLCLCNIPSKENDKFILFDKEKDVDIEKFGFENKEDITFEQMISTYRTYPILSLNDFTLRTFKPKARTTTHILGELGINTWEQLEHEHFLIEIKISNLSRSQRELIEKRYNELMYV